MPDLIHLAVPAFLLLVTLEAAADAVMRRDLYEIAGWRDDSGAPKRQACGPQFLAIQSAR